MARRRGGAAGDRDAPRGRRDAPPQHLRSPPPSGLRGRRGGRPPRPAGVPPLPVRSGGNAALRRHVLVGRHQQRLPDPRGPAGARAQHRPVRDSVLGHGHRRLLPSGPGDRRALRALVPARRLQPDLPLARLGLAGARAVGARSRGGGDLPALRRAPLPAAPVHLHAGLAGAHPRPAPHAAAGPQLSGRPPGLDDRPRVPLGRRPPGGAGDARGRDRVAGLPPRGPVARLLDRRVLRGPGGRHAPRPRRPAAAPRPGRRDPADGTGRPAHRRAAARRGDAPDLSGRRVALRALRGRRPVERLPPGPPRADAARVRDRARPRDGPDRPAGRRPVGGPGRAALRAPAPDGPAGLGDRGRPRRAAEARRARRGGGGLVGRRRGVHPRPPARPARPPP